MNYVEDHRVRPPDPLVLHPTARPMVYRTVEYAGEDSWVKRLDETCNGVTTPKSRVELWGSSGGFAYYSWYNAPPPPVDWTNRARLAIKNIAQNLGASTFEYRESASLFYKTGKVLYDVVQAARKIRKGRVGGMVRAAFGKNIRPKDVSGFYLGDQFGIAPLLDDLGNAIARLEERVARPLIRKIVVGDSDKTSVKSVDYAYKGSYVHEKRGTYDKSVRAILYVELVPDYHDFTWGNPLEVAWELTPMSFMVDWFLPVGGWLSSLDALKDVRGVTGTATYKTIQTWWSATTSGPNEYRMVRPQTRRDVAYWRDTVSQIPVPPFPRWQPSASWHKLALALAVGHQLFGK